MSGKPLNFYSAPQRETNPAHLAAEISDGRPTLASRPPTHNPILTEVQLHVSIQESAMRSTASAGSSMHRAWSYAHAPQSKADAQRAARMSAHARLIWRMRQMSSPNGSRILRRTAQNPVHAIYSHRNRLQCPVFSRALGRGDPGAAHDCRCTGERRRAMRFGKVACHRCRVCIRWQRECHILLI